LRNEIINTGDAGNGQCMLAVVTEKNIISDKIYLWYNMARLIGKAIFIICRLLIPTCKLLYISVLAID